MKLFILDDEASARNTVKAYLAGTSIQVDEMREAASVEEGLQVLKEYTPDLALMDINLPDGLSFDLLAQLGFANIPFKIVFISAYDDYAIKAFKYNAIDYILKPINPIEFKEALSRAVESHNNEQEMQLQNLSRDLSNQMKELDKLVLKDHQSIHLIDFDQIVQCKSESNYTVFCLTDNSEVVISRTLKDYEDILREKQFFRSHRSHLINLKHLKKYDKREGGFIEMSDGSVVPLARTKKDIFMKVLEKI